MKKIFELLIFCLLLSLAMLVLSCGTRKSELTHSENIDINNTYQTGSKIVLGNNFTYTPFDALKPMVIEGKTYSNAIVSNDKSQTIIKWNDRFITKTITVEKTKSTTRTDYTFLFLGMFLIVVIAVFLWFKTGK